MIKLNWGQSMGENNYRYKDLSGSCYKYLSWEK